MLPPQELLPPGTECPSSFETVGHIAHVNLREELLPFKSLIGEVLLDKNSPNIRTILNKARDCAAAACLPAHRAPATPRHVACALSVSRADPSRWARVWRGESPACRAEACRRPASLLQVGIIESEFRVPTFEVLAGDPDLEVQGHPLPTRPAFSFPVPISNSTVPLPLLTPAAFPRSPPPNQPPNPPSAR